MHKNNSIEYCRYYICEKANIIVRRRRGELLQQGSHNGPSWIDSGEMIVAIGLRKWQKELEFSVGRLQTLMNLGTIPASISDDPREFPGCYQSTAKSIATNSNCFDVIIS